MELMIEVISFDSLDKKQVVGETDIQLSIPLIKMKVYCYHIT